MSPLPAQGNDGPDFEFTALHPPTGDGILRTELVDLSANFTIPGAAYIPVNQLALSALGADADLHAVWNATGFSLAEWRHIATGGRDQYVKIVFRGYVFPLGHRAVIISVVERVLMSDPANPTRWSNAVLQEKVYVRVLQPVKTYPAAGQPFDGNSWPFSSVEFKTLVTPPIDPVAASVGSAQAQSITVAGQEFLWKVVATDHAGRLVRLTVPLVFVYAEDLTQGYGSEFDTSTTGPIVSAYQHLPAASRTTGDLGGQPVQYAPEVGGPPAGTSHPTHTITLSAASPDTDPSTATDPTTVGSAPLPPSMGELESGDQPAFYPVLGAARISLPAADHVAGSSFHDSQGSVGVSIEPYGRYVVSGLPHAGNAGGVYAVLSDALHPTPAPPLLRLPGDGVGAVATPSMGVIALATTAGAVGGSGPGGAGGVLDTFASSGAHTPAACFAPAPGQTGHALPQLFGGLHLADILGAFTGAGMPVLTTQVDPVTGVRTVTYTLTATTVSGPPGLDVFVPDGPGNEGTLSLTSVTTLEPGAAKATQRVKGTLSAFSIQIMGTSGGLDFIKIPFGTTTFTSVSGSKPDVRTRVGSVEFQGALSFVNSLQQFLEGLGGSGFSVAVTPAQVSVGSSVGLPSVGIGIISLEHLNLTSSVEIPFSGAPALATFSFASREHQFLVSVAMFGGGGFVTLVLGMRSVQKASGSIDFAGNFSLDVGVASGGVTLAAGISFIYQSPPTGLTLTGFVRISGEVEVLGLIGVSLELDLSLSYNTSSGKAEGTATMEASVNLAFFSVTVGITVHKEFSHGSPAQAQGAMPAAARAQRALAAAATGPWPPPPADGPTPPSFGDLMPPDPGGSTSSAWSEYIGAFGPRAS